MSSITESIANPLLVAPVALLGGWWWARSWRHRSSLIRFLIQVLVFGVFTGLLAAGGVTPYRLAEQLDHRPSPFVGALEIAWWWATAWAGVGFLRAFVVLGQRPHEAKLLQELFATLLYVAAIVGIIGYVFDLPLKGLLATSGALAIIIGLALQSTLSDVFSGIVLNLERPYRVGDWIVLDDNIQGTVIETNWRATRIQTATLDEASFPNSVVAKSKLINCSRPTRYHGSSIRVKLAASLGPAAGCHLLNEVLLGSTTILRDPAPVVTVKDISAEMTDWELFYFVSDIGGVSEAQNEIFDRIYRSVAVAGARFAPRLSTSATAVTDNPLATPERLLAGISLFSTLTLSEREMLAAQLTRKEYRSGDVIVSAGTVVQALCILSYGVLSAAEQEHGRHVERVRLTPGSYFGEMGLLTGQAFNGEIKALTDVVIYEISKQALWPLLEARPHMVVELGEALAALHLGEATTYDPNDNGDKDRQDFARRIASTIKRLFSLH